MLEPEYIRGITDASEEIASQMHTYIIQKIVERIMIRLGRGEDYLLTATDKWQIEAMQDAGYLYDDIMHELSVYSQKQSKEIKDAMEEAGVKAMSWDSKVYEAAGISTAPIFQSPHLIRIMQRNYDATMAEVKNFTGTTASESQQLFLSQLDKAYNIVTSGATTYTEAVKEAIDTIVKDGITVRYPSGHKDTVETATLRAVRTGISQATGEIQITRMEELNWDIILTSAHLGARSGDGGQNPGNHLWWQGQFFSRTGKTKDFPNFYKSTGYGTLSGLCGVNCRHSFGPGDGKNNPFKNIGYEDNFKIEELNKQQRLLERRIRASKRELTVLKSAIELSGDNKLKSELQHKYDSKASSLQMQNKKYQKFCKQNELKPLQDRLRIAQWDRKQAMKAVGGARRYGSE